MGIDDLNAILLHIVQQIWSMYWVFMLFLFLNFGIWVGIFLGIGNKFCKLDGKPIIQIIGYWIIGLTFCIKGFAIRHLNSSRLGNPHNYICSHRCRDRNKLALYLHPLYHFMCHIFFVRVQIKGESHSIRNNPFVAFVLGT